MYKVDRNHGAVVTTTGKLARPARRHWWEIVGYREGSEGDEVLSISKFDTEDLARATFARIKVRPGAVVMTEDGHPELEYIVTDGVEYVLSAHSEQDTWLED